MIVPMRKVHLVARAADRDRLLEALRGLGVVHLVPIEPSRALADEQTVRQVGALQRALQVLSEISPAGSVPGLGALDAAQQVLDIQQHSAERRSRLTVLYRELTQLELWGDLERRHLRELQQAGIEVAFYAVPRQRAGEIEADCAEVVAALPGRQVLVAAAGRGGAPSMPDWATPVAPPPRDAPSIRAEAAEIDAALKRDAQRLPELARLVPAIKGELACLQQQAEYTIALRGAAADEHLFALQGWAPAEMAPGLGEQLGAGGIAAAAQVLEPEPEEQPPTLVRSPAWARPIEGLFQMLGTVPGYREFDVSVPFLIALPIFTAMLISDAAYGALMVLVPALAYRRVSRIIGPRFTQLMILIGGVTLIWGCVVSSFFGFALYPPLISVDLSERSRSLLMSLSFTLGAIHLSLAQGWQAIRLWPHLAFLGKLGWAIFIWGTYGVVKMLVLKGPMGWNTPWPYLLLTGGSLAILFASPNRNILKMLALGVANFPLSMLSAFSDIISYVRLMAVGLVSGVLAASFNEMARNAEFWPVAVLIFLFGHALNLGLALIAMFAHGVRLNMLEFSNNLGMQWSGHAYRPFVEVRIKEHSS
jgi:V/A-type H+-transporting ATPase subunit I